jgi:hypothetical protein
MIDLVKSLAELEKAQGARRELAEYWLECSDEEAREDYAGELGRHHQGILVSGVREWRAATGATELEKRALARLREGEPGAGGILAGMVLFHPHQWPGVLDLERVPGWLTDSYLNWTMQLPKFYSSEGEGELAAQRLEEQLGEFLKDLDRSAELRGKILASVARLQAIPAYFNRRNLRGLFERRGRLLEKWLADSGYVLEHRFGERGSRGRIRVGILANNFRAETETLAALPMYRELDRERFEVILLAPGMGESEMERLCARCAEREVSLPAEAREQVGIIRELDLDVLLVATNVTAATNPITILAAHRLARVQIATIHSCVTTGLKNIDWHLTGKLFERGEGAGEDYTEKLLMIEGTGHCYDFGTEPAGPVGKEISRGVYGIGENEIVFVSGANAHKIVPEVQEAWGRILAATPGSRLLIHPENPNWMRRYPIAAWLDGFYRRLGKHGVARERVIISEPTGTRQEILKRMQMGDVYLDSFPYSGPTTVLDGLLAGLAPVVLDGNNFRSLQGAGMMRELGMEEMVAKSEEEYVALAVKLARDGAYCAAINEKLAAAMKAGPRFLDGKDYARRMEGAIEMAWGETRNPKPGRHAAETRNPKPE